MNKKIAKISIDLYQRGLLAKCDELEMEAMCNSLPVHIKDTTYRVEVENNVQLESLNSNMAKLLGFLRNEVENDSLSIQVVCAPKAIASVPYTPKRIIINKKL